MKATTNTPLSQAIAKFEDKNLTKFKPDKRFYTQVGINRIRFWQLVRGEKDFLGAEINSISNYFSIPVQSFFQTKNPELLA